MSWVGGADCGEAASGWGSGGNCAVVLFALPHFFLWVGVYLLEVTGEIFFIFIFFHGDIRF